VSRTRLEICLTGAAEARAAVAGGADRLELCRDLAQDGLTPELSLVRAVCREGEVPVVVLIRPRPGGFVYDAGEREAMAAAVEQAGEAGAAGVALGALTADGSVDEAVMGELLRRARPLSVCFHRAFDQVADPVDALERLIALGVDRLLTSGRPGRAEDHLPLLAELVRRADERLVVMPGGGLRPENVAALVAATGAREVHSSAGGVSVDAVTALRRALDG
jgi:copper homeostasis protein